MSKQILIPYDGSEQAETALDFALDEFPEGEITLLHVIDPVEAGYSSQTSGFGRAEEWYEQAKAGATELFASARNDAETAGVELSTATQIGRPARAIVEYAEAESTDQIVMGSHGRSGVSRILLGSVAEKVVRRSPVPVTVVR